MWGKSDEFGQLIRRNWKKDLPGYPMYTLARNLKNLKPALKELNRKKFSDIEVKSIGLELKVKKLQEDIGRNPTMERIEEEHLAVREHKEVSVARDSYMAQKMKRLWIQEGDSNTAYFHGILRGRRDQNKVILLEDMVGVVCDNSKDIQKLMQLWQKI
ncbi:hypothetical protein vseg_011673 [Gypsophila vaccaria]